MVVDLLVSKIQSEEIDIKSVFHPAEIKGYVFIEGTAGSVHKAIQGLMHSRGLINKPIQLQEIQHFLELKKTRIQIDEGDIMEIIGGPFKGEKGRIIRINKIKDEVTAELLEASIPIPVTIATEFVKIIKKVKPAERLEKVQPKVPEPLEEEEEKDKLTGMIEEEEKKMKEEQKVKEAGSGEGGKAEGGEPQEEKMKEEKESGAEETGKKKRKSFLEELEGFEGEE